MALASLIVGFGLATRAAAIWVAPGSPCDPQCGNVLDMTTPPDITCQQTGYGSDAGLLFEQCIGCEISSDYHTQSNNTDVQWVLYNLRYTLSYCLFGVPQNKHIINTPCITKFACGQFMDGIVYKNMSSSVGEYDYCDSWPVTDSADFGGCLACLEAGDQQYLGNFFSVLQAGCEQKPVPGVTLSLSGSPFSVTQLNITSPSPTATINPEWINPGPFGLGAKVGIVIGGLAAILIFLGCCIIWRGKRRRRAFLRSLTTRPPHKGWPSPLEINEMNDTPVSQRPLRGWDDSPQSAVSEQTFSRYISPYSSQYNSPVSASDALGQQWPSLTVQAQGQAPQPGNGLNIGVALGGGAEQRRDSTSKGKDPMGDSSYELQQLQSTETAQEAFQQQTHLVGGQTYEYGNGGMTEEDMRRGHAF